MRDDEFVGLEFDWVAADSSGRLAIFCSAGYGPVSAIALRSAEDQEALLELIATHTVHRGTLDLLTQPGNSGIYCFDWKLYQGPYHLEREPPPDGGIRIDVIPEGLRTAVTRLDLGFTGKQSISSEEMREI